MRKFYSLITMLLIVTIASSQTTYTWNNAAGGQWTDATKWTPNRNAPATTDILVFSTGASFSVTNIPTQTIGRLNVSAGTVTFSGQGGTITLTINNSTGGADLIIANGATLVQNATVDNLVLGNSATADISGTLTENGTYNTNGTSVVTTVSGTGIIDNRNTVTNTTAAKLVMSSGSRYIHARDGGNIPDANWNANSTLEYTGITTNLPTNYDQSVGNLTWNNTLQSGAISFAGQMTTINGDFNVQSTGSSVLNLKISGGGTQTTTVAGDFNLSGGSLFICGTSGGQTLAVQGDVNISGGTLSRGGTSTSNFQFDGPGATIRNFTKTGGTLSGVINWTINAGSTVNFGTSILDGAGNFTLSGTAKIISGSANGINSTGANGSIQVTGTRSFSSTADYEFRGAATGVFTTNPTAATLANITVNNGGGDVTLNQPMAVTGSLTLTAGALVSTSTNILNLANNATSSVGSNASFVSGPIRKTGNDAFTFPVGKVGTGYVPIAMSAPGSTTTVMTAEYMRGTPPNSTNITAPGVTRISTCDYWTLVQTGTASAVGVTLNWNANSPCNGANYVTQPSTIKAVSYNGTNWNLASAANGTGTNATGSVVFAGATAFNSFAIGTTASGSNNPLPVLFDNVRAYERSGGIEIGWSNLTERDLVEYVVERSANGRDYTDYISVAPKSNLNEKADYSQFDASPASGANFYRIRCLEISGKTIYSKVLRVDMGVTKKGFSLYPNPVIGKALTITLTGVNQGAYNVRVVTTTGQDVFHKTIQAQASGITQSLQLPSTMKPGVYTMVVTGEGYSQNQMFIVQ